MTNYISKFLGKIYVNMSTLMQIWQIRIPGNNKEKELGNYFTKTLNQMVNITHCRVKNL